MKTTQPNSLKPVQLIYFDSNKNVCINQQAADLISNFATQQIHVITVAGKYRTGKSYILNKVLLNRSSGFEVGSTINACTKGLWMWPELVKLQSQDEVKDCLVIDTQGLGSLQEGENTDLKIFLMAMFLSSYLIYNSVGSIDQKAIENLSLVINLASMLNKQADNYDTQELINSFPSFMWLVRDFSLKLVNQDGQQITPKQYLENGLKYLKGNSKAVERKNQVRKKLRNFFQNRDCFTLVRPTESQKDLQNLNTLSSKKLRPEFLDLIEQLRAKIYQQAKPKRIRGKTITPQGFIQICKYFVQTLNSGKLPSINSHWDNLCTNQSQRIIGDYQIKHLQRLSSIQVQGQFWNMKQIQERHLSIMKEAQQKINRSFLGKLEKELSKERLRKTLDSIYQQMINDIEEKQHVRIQEILNQVFQQIITQFKSNKLQSFQEVFDRFQSIRQQYRSDSRIYESLYQNSKGVFRQFIRSLQELWQKQNSTLFSKNNALQTTMNSSNQIASLKLIQLNQQLRDLQSKYYKGELEYQKLLRQNELISVQQKRIKEQLQDTENQLQVAIQQSSSQNQIIFQESQKLYSKTLQTLQEQNKKLQIRIIQLEQLYRESNIKERKSNRQAQILKNKCSEYLRQNLDFGQKVQQLQTKISQYEHTIRKLSIFQLQSPNKEGSESQTVKNLYLQINELQFALKTTGQQKKILQRTLTDQREMNQALMKTPQNINYLSLKKSYQVEKKNNELLKTKNQDLMVILEFCSEFLCPHCHKSLQRQAIKVHTQFCHSQKHCLPLFDVSYFFTDQIEFQIQISVRDMFWTVRKTVKSIVKLLRHLKFDTSVFDQYQILEKSAVVGSQAITNLYEKMRVEIYQKLSPIASLVHNDAFLTEYFAFDIHLCSKNKNQSRDKKFALKLQDIPLNIDNKALSFMKTTKHTKKAFNFTPQQ